MAKLRSNGIILVLAFCGLVVALFLTVKHFLPDLSTPGCSVTASCKTVLESVYGKVGPIPIGAFGAGMYALLIVLCLKRGGLIRSHRLSGAGVSSDFGSAPASVDSESARNAARELDADVPAASDSFASSDVRGVESASSPSDPTRADVLRLDGLIWLLSLMGVVISWWLQYTSLFNLKSFCPYCFSSATIISLIFLLASRDRWIDGRDLTGEQKMLGGVGAFVAVCLLFSYVPGLIATIQQFQHPAPIYRKEITQQELDPAVIATPDTHYMGDPKAPITVVEFADYQCPSCAKAARAMVEFMQANKGKVRLGFRNFPLKKHENARVAAIAAEAAARQGESKFWAMHDEIFKHQPDLDAGTALPDTTFDEYAVRAGLDATRWQRDKNDPKLDDRIRGDAKDGERGGLDVTPTFFVINAKRKMWRYGGIDVFLNAVNNPNSEIYR